MAAITLMSTIEVSFEIVEAFLLDHLTRDFVCDLITPIVDWGHVDVVDEDGNFLATRWALDATEALVHVGFDGTLEHEWCGDCTRLTQYSRVDTYLHLVTDTTVGIGVFKQAFINRRTLIGANPSRVDLIS